MLVSETKKKNEIPVTLQLHPPRLLCRFVIIKCQDETETLPFSPSPSQFPWKNRHPLEVGVLWMIQVQTVRHSDGCFRPYSSLIFPLCSEMQGFSEGNKGSFTSNWLLSGITVFTFPRWNQASDYKSQGVFIKFYAGILRHSVKRKGEIKKTADVQLWLCFEQ